MEPRLTNPAGSLHHQTLKQHVDSSWQHAAPCDWIIFFDAVGVSHSLERRMPHRYLEARQVVAKHRYANHFARDSSLVEEEEEEEDLQRSNSCRAANTLEPAEEDLDTSEWI